MNEINDKYVFGDATTIDIDRIKKYKRESIFRFAGNLSSAEVEKIDNYIDEVVPKQINCYKNIILCNNIIGSFLVREIDEGILLDEIYIEENCRNRGIGTSIIEDIINNSDSNIYLWVYKDNTMAIKLYMRLGFKIKNTTDNRYYMEYQK